MASIRLFMLGSVVAAMAGGSARAGMFDDVVEGLQFAGFVLDSTHVDKSNTSMLVAAHNFQGNTIDLGDFDFALAGPVSLLVEAGGRGIPEVGITLSTGLLSINPNQVATVAAAQPLVYTFGFDAGTNNTQIVGNMAFDLRAKINRFGSYDFRFMTANRQTTTVDGRFEEFPITSGDFDIGPIDIEGNIFADMLATLADPFFDAAGIENVFAQFSGRTFREAKARETVDSLRAKVESGGTLTEDELSTLTAMKLISDVLGDELPSLEFVTDGLPASGTFDGTSTIPEPATGLLLASGLGLLLRHRRRIS